MGKESKHSKKKEMILQVLSTDIHMPYYTIGSGGQGKARAYL